jgi:hypothetical protein
VGGKDGSVSITFTPEKPEQCAEAGGKIVFVSVTVATAVVATARFTG